MNSKDINALLERYKEGTCTAEEKLKLEQWFDLQSESASWEWTDDEKANTGSVIKGEVDRQLDAARVKTYPWLKPFMTAAAVFLLLTTLFYFRTQIYNKINPPEYVVQQAPAGQQLKITLNDGSAIWLNAQSKIKYPKRFNGDIREVFLLEGEAFFEVQHDESKPFIVRSGNVSTYVLGTAFNVRNFAYLDDVQVSVKSGKVGVDQSSLGNKTTFLLPNEQLSINRNTGAIAKSNVDAENVTGWQQGRLVFNNESFSNVAAVLERTYKIKVHFEDPYLKNYRLTAGFEKSDRLEDVVYLLSRVNKLSYKFVNKDLFFRKE